MAREYFEHVTRSGDRWDLIAHDYYGDATLTKPLMLANPDIIGNRQGPAPLIFEAGVKLQVPVLAEDEIAVSKLPPWKRRENPQGKRR